MTSASCAEGSRPDGTTVDRSQECVDNIHELGIDGISVFLVLMTAVLWAAATLFAAGTFLAACDSLIPGDAAGRGIGWSAQGRGSSDHASPSSTGPGTAPPRSSGCNMSRSEIPRVCAIAGPAVAALPSGYAVKGVGDLITEKLAANYATRIRYESRTVGANPQAARFGNVADRKSQVKRDSFVGSVHGGHRGWRVLLHVVDRAADEPGAREVGVLDEAGEVRLERRAGAAAAAQRPYVIEPCRRSPRAAKTALTARDAARWIASATARRAGNVTARRHPLPAESTTVTPHAILRSRSG